MNQTKISDKVMQAFYHLLSSLVNGTQPNAEKISLLSEEEWQELSALSRVQGVKALVFDAIRLLPQGACPPNQVLFEWIGNASAVEKRMRKMREVAFDYAKSLAEEGLKMYVLKGIGVSTYYPKPLSRECGDLDCFVMTTDGQPAYEVGNVASEKIGACVKRDYYKHSHIGYCGLTIENHQFCTGIRGGKEKKAFERHLQNLLARSGNHGIENSVLLMPSADFTALFLTAHSLSHCLFEKIHFRHILDWAMFVQAVSRGECMVDWASFWDWCDRMHYTRFVLCLNWICRHVLSMEIDLPEPNADFDVETVARQLLADVFSDEDCMTVGMSYWKELWVKTCGFFRGSWKYSDLLQQNALSVLLGLGWAFVVERNPRI